MMQLAGCALWLVIAGQQSAPYVGAAEINAFMEKARAGNVVDQLVKEIVVNGQKVAVAFLRRVKPETNGLIHNHVSETYQILQGSGTLVTGGTLTGAKPNDLTRVAAGIGQSGVHEGGTAQKVGAGDVVIVPAGMPHRFSELSGEILYLVYRFDSNQAP